MGAFKDQPVRTKEDTAIKIKNVGLSALRNAMKDQWKSQLIDPIISRFGIEKPEVKSVAFSVYYEIMSDQPERIARLAQRFELGDTLVSEPATTAYTLNYDKKNFLEAARNCIEFRLPEDMRDRAVKNLLYESMLNFEDRNQKVSTPATEEVIGEFGPKPQTVKEVANSVYDFYIERRRYRTAAYHAKKHDLEPQKQTDAAEAAYGFHLVERSYGSGRNQIYAAIIARDFGLGEEKQNKAIKDALMEMITSKDYKLAMENAVEFGVSSSGLKDIAIAAFEFNEKGGRNDVARDILGHYGLDVPAERKKALIIGQYDDLAKGREDVKAMEFAMVENLGIDKIYISLKSAYWDKWMANNYVGATALANSANRFLIDNGYGIPAESAEKIKAAQKIHSEIQKMGRDAVEKTFNVMLDERKCSVSEAYEKAADMGISMERQAAIATEVIDAHLSRPHVSGYANLLEIATKYELKDKVGLVLDEAYVETLRHSAERAEKISSENNMPPQKILELQNRVLLEIMGYGSRQQTLAFIEKIMPKQTAEDTPGPEPVQIRT